MGQEAITSKESEKFKDLKKLSAAKKKPAYIIKRVNRVNNRLDRPLLKQLEQLGKYLQDIPTWIIHLIREQEIVEIKPGQGSALVVQLKRRDLIHMPPVFGQSKVIFAFAIAQVPWSAVEDVLAEWLCYTDAFICVFTT